jgi:uncharacterized repeat protein (TIGR03943 family)
VTIPVERLRPLQVTVPFDLRRFLASFILAGYGIFIVSLFLRQVMTWYINPVYVGPTTFAGAVLIGLGALAFRHKAQLHDHDESCVDEDCGCVDPAPKLRTYVILAIPLFLAVVFPPRSLAAFSALQRGPQIAGLNLLHGPASVKRVSLSVDTRSFGMADWVGALSADPNPKDYAGKPVQLTGMVLHSPGSVPDGYIMVMRFFVTCCIADARPVGLMVRDTSHGALKDSQWVSVTGTMSSLTTGGQQIAVVKPTRIVPTKAGDAYIY